MSRPAPHISHLAHVRQPRERTGERPAPAAILMAPFGDVAQLAERYLCKVDVRGSIPLVSTKST